MITVNKTETKDLVALRSFLSHYKLDESVFMERLDQTVVLVDRGEILGFGAFVQIKDYGLIDTVLIKDEILWPSMGDGIVKTMLNTLDLRGVRLAYMLTDDAHAALVKKIGLKSSELTAEDVLEKLKAPWILKNHTVVFETRLPDFFDHACHSKGRG